MPQGPAARLGDPTAHGTPLAPGPPSKDVIIGMKPAWLGVLPAAAQVLQAAKKASDKVLGVLAQTTLTAAGVVPPVALPAAQAAEVAGRAAALGAMTGAINGAAGGMASIHMCAIPFAAAPPDMAPSPCPPGPPHGPGVVIDGSTTVMINNLPACRQGDHVLEALGPLDPIAVGCPTVIIGG